MKIKKRREISYLTVHPVPIITVVAKNMLIEMKSLKIKKDKSSLFVNKQTMKLSVVMTKINQTQSTITMKIGQSENISEFFFYKRKQTMEVTRRIFVNLILFVQVTVKVSLKSESMNNF